MELQGCLGGGEFRCLDFGSQLGAIYHREDDKVPSQGVADIVRRKLCFILGDEAAPIIDEAMSAASSFGHSYYWAAHLYRFAYREILYRRPA